MLYMFTAYVLHVYFTLVYVTMMYVNNAIYLHVSFFLIISTRFQFQALNISYSYFPLVQGLCMFLC